MGKRIIVMFLWKINASIEPRWGFPNLTLLLSAPSLYMTRNNESHWVGQFFTSIFSASCIRRSDALWLVYFLHNSQCTLLFCYYAGAVSKKLHNQLKRIYKAIWTPPTNNFFLVIFLTIISKLSTSELAPWYRSSPWCGYNSSLTSSVTLSVSDSAISLLWRLQPYGFHCQ